MKETDLASKVVKWLSDQHWDVYQEVKFGYGGIADIAATRAGYLWIIECKTTLTLTVIRQATRWASHFRSIAVPEGTNHDDRHFAYNLAHDYFRLGIIEYRAQNGIIEMDFPPIMREYHKRAKRMMRELREEHKTYLPAGSNGGGYYTPYRETMDHVKRFIRMHPGCTLKEIMDDVGNQHHYCSNATARSSIRVALSNWESWCDVRQTGKEYTYFVKEQK